MQTTTTTVTMFKSSALKMIILAPREITMFCFNGVEYPITQRKDFVNAIIEWPASEFDYRIEDGTTLVIESFQIVDIYRNECNNGAADWLEIQYNVPGDTIPTSTPMYFKQILPLAVELELIDDYTFDYDVEVVYNVEQPGYISASSGEWCELPIIRRRVNWNDWLRNLDYEELQMIGTLFIKKNIAR